MSSVTPRAPSSPPRWTPMLWRLFEGPAARFKSPLFAVLLVGLSALPALLLLPPLDRDESRFAQASAQMLETGDFTNIRYQGDPRDKKPVGIHWLQALSVTLFSSVEQRRIWAYRLPSLLGAMTAAGACAWGARAVLGARAGVLAGAVMASGFLLSSEAFIAKTDAVLCGAVTLSMAALGLQYAAHRRGVVCGPWPKALFWLGQAVAILDKGPIGPMVAGLALLSLSIADRNAAWMRRLGWGWGLIFTALVVGPWTAAITVATDGSFWTGAVAGDLAPKMIGGHETHGAPPGLHALLLPLLSFPNAALLPAAAVYGWVRRREAGVRFALAWLLPSWVVFEILPTKLVHYTLPLYGAVAWLCAAAFSQPTGPGFGPRARGAGAVLAVLSAGLIAAAAVGLSLRYGGRGAQAWATAAAALAGLAGLLSGGLLLRRRPQAALAAGVVVGVLAHAALTGGLAPRLDALWTSQRAARRLEARGLDPRNGVVAGPVAVVGYAEPSLVFALGTATELDDPKDAVDALADGQPALVERRRDGAFRTALAAAHTAALPVDEVQGFDYSTGKPVDLTLWRSALTRPDTETAP